MATSALEHALQHSFHVRVLKIGIWGILSLWCALSVIFPLYSAHNPDLRPLMSQEGVLNGSQVTMESPKLNGFRADGKPYEVRAGSGVQDVKIPNVIQLNEINARLAGSDNGMMDVQSGLGVYDATKDFMSLPRDVHVNSQAGYRIDLKSAEVDFKTGSLSSQEPADVKTKDMSVSSNQIRLSESGNRIEFLGGVRSTLTSPQH